MRWNSPFFMIVRFRPHFSQSGVLRFLFDGRPFNRRLPEFQFWLSSQKGVLMSFGMTFLSIFDIPVFWPILLVYFVVLMVCCDWDWVCIFRDDRFEDSILILCLP